MIAFRGRLSFSILPQPTATRHIQVWTLTFARVLVTVPPRTRSAAAPLTADPSAVPAPCQVQAINGVYTHHYWCLYSPVHPRASPSPSSASPEAAQCSRCHSRPRFLMSLVPPAQERADPGARAHRLHHGLTEGIRNGKNWLITLKHHCGTVGPRAHQALSPALVSFSSFF